VIGIVIVAHGGLAREYLAALEHVVGRHPGTAAVSIDPEDDSDAKQDEIDAAVRSVDIGDGVVVVTDMFGGTPSNLAMEACRDPGRTVIYGANLPLLVKLAKARRLPLNEAVATALDAGRKYIDSVESFGPGRLPIAL
jgi:PTS system mannose-specific IIA component